MALKNCIAYTLGTHALNMTFTTDEGDVKYGVRITQMGGIKLGFKDGQVALYIFPNTLFDNTLIILNSDLVALGTTASAAYDAIYAKLVA